MILNLFFKTIKLSNISNLNIFKFGFFSFISTILDLFSIALLSLIFTKFFLFNTSETNLKLFSRVISFDPKAIILFLLLIIFFKFIFLFYLNKKIFSFSNEKQHDLRLKLFLLFSRLNFLKFLENSPSLYTALVGNHIKVLGNFIAISIQFIGEVFFIIIIISLLLYINFKFISFLIIFFIIVFYCVSKLKFLDSHKVGKITTSAYKNLYSFVNNFFQSFKELRTYQKVATINLNLRNYSIQLTNSDIKNNIINLFPRLLIEFIVTVSLCIFFLFLLNAESFNISLKNETELLSILVASTLRLLPFFISSLRYLVNIKYSRSFIEELYKNIEYLEKFQEKKKINYKNKKVSKIAFKNIYYNYNNKLVLENVSFECKIGEFIGIKGKSGSGKSTLLNIICGLLVSNKSLIYINGIKIKKNETIINLFAYVPQDKFLFEGEIWKNISLENDKKNCNLKKIEEVLKKVRLDYDINYLLYNNGNNLSGGQKQRLVIARALYFEKKIIILDESTNELDTEVEKEILSDIKKQKDIIVILVSHKNKALSYCDRKYELKDNRLIAL